MDGRMMMSPKRTDSNALVSVRRAMEIIEFLSEHPEGVQAQTISSHLGISRPDTSRILNALVGSSFVSRDDRSYALTWKLVAAARRYADGLPLEEVLRPALSRLAEKTGELIQVAVPDGDQLVFVSKIDGSKPLRVGSMIGRLAPLHASAAGRMWLATLNPERAEALLEQHGTAALTEYTLTNPKDVLAEIAKARQKGYAYVAQETNLGVCAIAVSATSPSGRQAAFVTISLPIYEAAQQHIDHLVDLLKEAARQISERLPD